MRSAGDMTIEELEDLIAKKKQSEKILIQPCSAPQQEILDNTRKTISNMESTYRFKFALGGRILT